MLVGVLPFLAGGCKDTLLDRSLIFSTHTTLGMEISVQPVDAATTPMSLVVGYKRTEGVLNPVYHSEGIETPDQERITSSASEAAAAKPPTDTNQPRAEAAPSPDARVTTVQTRELTGRRPRYHDDAYSVLAKFQGDTSGKIQQSAEAGMSVAQWFATGPAADTLAGQPGIAGAISGSSKIGEAAAEEAGARRLSVRSGPQADVVISAVYNGLKELADGGDTQARFYVAGLDTLGELAPDTIGYYQRTPPDSNGVCAVVCKQVDCRKAGSDFKAYLMYRGRLKQSIATLEEAVKSNRPDLREQLDKYEADQKKLEADVGKCPQYLQAVEYYLSVLTGTERKSL
jgi:hypothetical protein